MTLNAGRPTQEGADTQGGSVVFGSTTARGSFIVAAETYKKNMIFSADRPYSAPDFGDGVNLGTTEGINEFGNTILDFFGPQGTDRADPNCDNVVDPNSGAPLFAGIYQDGPNESCAYAYAAVAGETQDISRDSIFINAEYEITPDVTAIYTGTLSQVEAFGRYASAVGGFCIDLDQIPNLDPSLQDLAGINTPNCNGDPTIDTVLGHRFVGLGPRDDYDTNTMLDNQITFEGTAGMFDWNAWVGSTLYQGKSRGFNYVVTSEIEALVASGDYNPLDPLNPSNEDAYGRMRHTVSRDIETDFKRMGGSVSFDALETPAGPVSWAVGFEYFDQAFRDVYDPQREAQNVIGSAGNSTSGDRTNYAMYVESLVPLSDALELSLAARYDDYDDSSGSETSPLAALRWQPSDNWLVRASWGQGFRAPNMTNLYSATSFSAEPVSDIVFCNANNISPCANGQADSFSGGNANLKPERSESFSVGFGWAMNRFNITADYWNIQIDEALTIPTAQELVNLEDRGIALPPGASIVRDLSGAISDCLPGQTEGCGITRPWLNLAMLDYTGIDLRIDYSLPLNGGSELNFRWIHSHMLEANEQTTPLSPVEDVAGTQDTPSFRSTLVSNWSMGDHNVSLITSYIDNYVNSNDERIPSWVTWDLQWAWDITANGRIVAGVLNLTDEDPPLDDFNDTAQPFNSDLYSMDGRVPYLQYRHTF